VRCHIDSISIGVRSASDLIAYPDPPGSETVGSETAGCVSQRLRLLISACRCLCERDTISLTASSGMIPSPHSVFRQIR
jgi:hypothetical protein